ncbi:hypothetical protein SEUCBS140593_005575 [Sporothrix eucalyptigena]|uniref:TauD/TfdA-like domain-containing protein n=1 Tax=Sporothrix eucalyptigena TaxID=1812306 RepID=A0ABP0BXN6_9PEZI
MAELVDPRIETFAIPGARVVHGKVFPLGLRVKEGQSFADIDEAVSHIEALADQGTLDSLLTDHSTILFRGFPLANASDFSRFVQAFKLPNQHQEVGLSGIRTTVNGFVKTANEEPSDVKFYYHSEYGRSAHFPGLLFFFSEVVPESGGQTPLLSSLELYDELKRQLPEFIQALADKGVIGRQYFPSKDDPEAAHIGWNWHDSYGFDIVPGDSLEEQHRKVEAVLRDRLQAEGEWQDRNGALYVLQRLPALRRVQSTGKPSFFNGLMGVYGRARDNNALEPPYKGLDQKYHLPTTYGDGSPIPYETLDKVLEIADSIGFLVPWQVGDVAHIDNYTVQHARTPWVGDRSLLVSLWDGREKFVKY